MGIVVVTEIFLSNDEHLLLSQRLLPYAELFLLVNALLQSELLFDSRNSFLLTDDSVRWFVLG